MSEKKVPNLGAIALDKMFLDDKARSEYDLPKVYDIKLDEIDDFPDHPFHVKIDEDMNALVDSIKERGLLTPILVRPKDDGRYEIVSGHRRRKACEIAGFDTIKANIREMSRDEAIVQMVESNLQRSTILPSEKAFSYKMRLEALKRLPGTRTDLTSDPVGPRLTTSEMVGKEVSESATQVKRYIRLTELIPELLDLVDAGKIALRPAVELSYLDKAEQKALYNQTCIQQATPSHAQAAKLRKFSEENRLNPTVIESIMTEEKPNQKEKVSLNYSAIRKYIPSSVPYDRTEEYIAKALEFYQKHLIREKNKDAR